MRFVSRERDFKTMSATESPIELVQLPFAFRLLRVRRSTWLTPHMVRITLEGDTLAGFRSDAADDGARLFFPPDPTDASWVPTVEGTTVVFSDEHPKPPNHEYTPRRYNAEAGELDIDFVVHGDGPASNWAANAVPGHYLGMSGPRHSRMITGRVDWYLLAGDETGLPSIARRLEGLPADTRAIAVIEVANAEEEQPIESPADLQLVWVHRDEAQGERSDLLAHAISKLDFPDGLVFAWAAGEASSIKAVRRHLVERGISLPRMRMTGYWKRSIPNWDHHIPVEES
jgi:NADPH-dependent ferric siderophore reductase